jgi:hypothetical protein
MKIVMVKLIKNTKQNTRYSNNRKFSLVGKSSGVIPSATNPGICAWYFGLCGEGCYPSYWTAWSGDDWWVFFFFFLHFPWSYEPSITSQSSDVVLPGDWLVNSIWFLLSTRQVAIRA